MSLVIVAFLTSVGLLGGGALILSGSKKPTQPISLPDQFYSNLSYFKLDRKTIFAVKNDGSQDEIVYEGNSVDASEKHLKELQLGFEKWLAHNSLSQIKNKDSKVNFS